MFRTSLRKLYSVPVAASALRMNSIYNTNNNNNGYYSSCGSMGPRRFACNASSFNHKHNNTVVAALWCATRFKSQQVGSQLIYQSEQASIQDKLKGERTLYEYMHKRISNPALKDKVACVQAETGQEMTYGNLVLAIQRMSELLYHEAKVRKGDVICISMLNTIAFGPSVFGALRLGAVVSAVNAVADAATFAYHLQASNAKVVLGMRYFKQRIEEGVAIYKKETGNDMLVLYPEDLLQMSRSEKISLYLNWQTARRVPPSYQPLKDATLDDTIFIPFSSGTTGLPKGVQLTNRNIIVNTEQVVDVHSVSPSDVCVCVIPFFHIFGFTCCLTTPLAQGGKQVVMVKYTLDTYLENCAKYKATVNLVAPPIVISLIKHKSKVAKYDLSSIRTIRSGAAPLSASMEKQLEELFPNCTAGQGYGMTEMSPVVTAVPAGVKPENRTYGSAGKLVADTEMRIVKVDETQQSGDDKSAGVDAAKGEEGEIWFRGPQMMKGYLKAEDTAKCMQDGWYRTGDIGKVDEKTGDLVITDRLKELIKYKGFQVSPAALENVLLDHPWVHECVVMGLPDPRNVSFEYPRALVVLSPKLTEEEKQSAPQTLMTYMRNKMPPHKRLHGGIRVVDSILKSEAGKVLRRQVKKEEVAWLARHAEEVKKLLAVQREEEAKAKKEQKEQKERLAAAAAAKKGK
uniref:4-coumarate--CoA ligase n=1 Tax=Strigomonas galati TaxID=1003336 RepID=T1YSV6_9TRYP|nr:4-coumarate--CoA ligase [Strigomonas galati]